MKVIEKEDDDDPRHTYYSNRSSTISGQIEQ